MATGDDLAAVRAADSLRERFWARHANPASGWSRVPTGPVLLAAVYRRDARLLVAGLLWTLLNPVLFPPPETDDAWMTRAVLAERWWTDRKRTLGVSYPNALNLTSALGSLVALVAAWRRRPLAAVVAAAVMVGGKLCWLHALVRRYDRRA